MSEYVPPSAYTDWEDPRDTNAELVVRRAVRDYFRLADEQPGNDFAVKRKEPEQ